MLRRAPAEHDGLIAEAKAASDRLAPAADDDERQVSGTVSVAPARRLASAPGGSRRPPRLRHALAAGGYYVYGRTQAPAAVAVVVHDGVIAVRSETQGARLARRRADLAPHAARASPASPRARARATGSAHRGGLRARRARGGVPSPRHIAPR